MCTMLIADECALFVYNRSTPVKLQKISRLSRVGFDENEKTGKLPERVSFYYLQYQFKILFWVIFFTMHVYFRNLKVPSLLIVKVV